jgi:hypothetical protein
MSRQNRSPGHGVAGVWRRATDLPASDRLSPFNVEWHRRVVKKSEEGRAHQWARRRRRLGWGFAIAGLAIDLLTIVAAGGVPHVSHGLLGVIAAVGSAGLIFGLALVWKADPIFAPHRLRDSSDEDSLEA